MDQAATYEQPEFDEYHTDVVSESFEASLLWVKDMSPITKYTVFTTALLTFILLAVLHTFFLNLAAVSAFLYIAYQFSHHIHNRMLRSLWEQQNEWEEAFGEEKSGVPFFVWWKISFISFFLILMMIIVGEMDVKNPFSKRDIMSYNPETQTIVRGLEIKPVAKPKEPSSGTLSRISKYNDLFEKYGNQQGVDPAFLKALATQESQGRKGATGPNTRYGKAKGLMQFIDMTAKRYGVTDPYDPEQAIRAAAKYQKYLLKHYNGDMIYAAAAYNWGEGNLDKYGIGKMPKETRNYVKQVAGYQSFYSSSSTSSSINCKTVESGAGRVTDESNGTCFHVKRKLQIARMGNLMVIENFLKRGAAIHLVSRVNIIKKAKNDNLKNPHNIASFKSHSGDIYLDKNVMRTQVKVADDLCKIAHLEQSSCSISLLKFSRMDNVQNDSMINIGTNHER